MKTIVQLSIIALLLLPKPALAIVTDWVRVEGGAVRLIADGMRDNGAYRAGLEFSLDPKWHTYWRFPGEAGIPPQIDSHGSTNLSGLMVSYPVPERYSDGFSTSFVYHNGIVLPLHVTPQDDDRPVNLTLSLFFGVCNEICVPGDANFTMTLSPDMAKDPLALALIDRDLENLPAAATDGSPRITGITVEQDETGARFVVAAKFNADTSTIDLLAEGPEGSYISVPEPQSRNGTSAVWTLSRKGLKTRADGTSELRFILIEDGEGFESLHFISSDLMQ